MTSREDPFPLVVLDALDARVPVIGFDGGGGFVELLQRDCGVLVPYLDTDGDGRGHVPAARAIPPRASV